MTHPIVSASKVNCRRRLITNVRCVKMWCDKCYIDTNSPRVFRNCPFKSSVRVMINPYEPPKSVSISEPALIPSFDRGQCPQCAHRNAIAEMLRTRDFNCRGCRTKLVILLEPRLDGLTLWGLLGGLG